MTADDGGMAFAWAAFRTRLVPIGGHGFRMTDGHLAGRPVEFVGRGGRVTGVGALHRLFTATGPGR